MSDFIHTSTVNAEFNSFFTKQKDGWWNLNTEFRVLHQANSLVLDYMKDVLQKENLIKGCGFQVSNDLKVLDVGCGGGILAEPLARSGLKVVGIDINRSAIEAAQAHAELDPCLTNRLIYKWESIEDHSLTNVEKYDIVILSFVLHHAKHHDVLLRNCIRTLKPGGLIFMSSIAKTYESWFRVVVLSEIVLRHHARGSFDWNCFINSSDVEEILKQSMSKTVPKVLKFLFR
ncbi:hypothetical protein RI129_012263 [Pyrocoelia pectoralis]|uniref:Methyltransferase type 11 domain-containing protein n=1 Tax=Pyrocoelia pectoralis TaxID=417401 RepID=A0AAN7V1G9_9COLE